jgi:hypothetical protein
LDKVSSDDSVVVDSHQGERGWLRRMSTVPHQSMILAPPQVLIARRAAVSFVAAASASSANARSGISSRVDDADAGAFADAGFEHDVARQNQCGRRVELEGLMSKGRVAGTENLQGRAVDSELGLQRSGDVDLGEDTEALVGQGCPDVGFGLIKGEGNGGFDGMHEMRLSGWPGGRVGQARRMNIFSTSSSG